MLGAFIEDAVAEAALLSGRTPRSLFPATVAYVLWSWQSRGTPLERSRIFCRALVEEFIHLGMGAYARGSKATHRATLTLLVDTLNPTEHTRARLPIPRSTPTAPYTEAEVAKLYSWATSQGTVRRQQDALALLVLGLGAGLATRELLAVRVSDVDTREAQAFVVVWEGRPRTVPISPSWRRPLRRIIGELDPADWAFRPGRSGANSGQVSDFLQRARTTLDVRPSRMRATWLLEHLDAGTAPHELLRISGLQNLAALDKIEAARARPRRQSPRREHR